LLFVKAAKSIAMSIVFLPLIGCTIATGYIFAALVKALSYAPDLEEVLFNYSILGFALVETFSFILFGISGLVYLV